MKNSNYLDFSLTSAIAVSFALGFGFGLALGFAGSAYAGYEPKPQALPQAIVTADLSAALASKDRGRICKAISDDLRHAREVQDKLSKLLQTSKGVEHTTALAHLRAWEKIEQNLLAQLRQHHCV